MSAVAERYAKHVNPEFVRLLGVLGYGRVFVRANGTRLVDDQGREYLDLLAGFGSVPIGHNHPRTSTTATMPVVEDSASRVRASRVSPEPGWPTRPRTRPGSAAMVKGATGSAENALEAPARRDARSKGNSS